MLKHANHAFKHLKCTALIWHYYKVQFLKVHLSVLRNSQESVLSQVAFYFIYILSANAFLYTLLRLEVNSSVHTVQ